MRTQREHIVSLIVAVIAILVIVGGYAAFTGLSVYEEPLMILMAENSFRQSDVFDVSVVVNPVTFMADESINRKTFSAIEHATKRIQMLLGQKITSKFCPHLHFKEDKHFKKTLKTLEMTDEVSKEFRETENQEEAIDG